MRTRLAEIALVAFIVTLGAAWMLAGPGRLAHFEGHGFRFAYPVEWSVIGTYHHVEVHGPTLFVSMGNGEFDLGCSEFTDADGNLHATCHEQQWTVPTAGVVVVFYRWSWLGHPLSVPTAGPGDTMTSVDGRAAVLTETAATMTWHLEGAPDVIEVRFGAKASALVRGQVRRLIASWAWDPAIDFAYQAGW